MSDDGLLGLLQGGVGRVLAERVGQADRWGESHDVAHLPGDLTQAGIAYAIYGWWQVNRDASGNPSGWTEDMVLEQALENWWPWDVGEFQPRETARENLAVAGALMAAEIDRDRVEKGEVDDGR